MFGMTARLAATIPRLPCFLLARPRRRASAPAPLRLDWRLQADAYARFGELYEAKRSPQPITEAACWAHPWTAPRAQGKIPAPSAITVVCSHPFGLASRRAGRWP